MKSIKGFPTKIPADESPKWATLIPHRVPEFKIHSSEGLAHNAMSNRSLNESFAKYELVNGEWILRYLYRPEKYCSACGVLYASDRERRHRVPYVKPVATAPVICHDCLINRNY